LRYNDNKNNEVEEMDDQVIKELIDAGKQWSAKITNEESIAIYDYTNMGYIDINGYLISGKNDDKTLNKKIELISNAISKFNFDKPITVYRGISYTEFDVILNSNKLNTFETFKSTSIYTDVANRFPEDKKTEYTILFKVPANSKGAYIQSNSEFPEEFEYLLDKGTRYIINRQESNVANKILVLEVLNNDY